MRNTMMLFPSIPETPRLPLLYVLLVDDNAVNRALMKRFITNHVKNYRIKPEEVEFDQAINGQIASETVERRLREKKPHYDVIIMDINMSATVEREGLIATKNIRALEEATAIERPAYIIRYSTDKPEPNEMELKEQGFNAMLNKHQTKQHEVDAVLIMALAEHPALMKRRHDDTPKHSS
ncbi:MAG TPA: response regulator [Gammaproteobacteria bacterium]|nr:response regulator [Gammaproteobacteria bacterium]